MTLTDYAAWAETIHSKATTRDRDRLLVYLGLGLTSEAGEVAARSRSFCATAPETLTPWPKNWAMCSTIGSAW